MATASQKTSWQTRESTRLAYLQALGVTSWLPLPDKINIPYGPVFLPADPDKQSLTRVPPVTAPNESAEQQSLPIPSVTPSTIKQKDQSAQNALSAQQHNSGNGVGVLSNIIEANDSHTNVEVESGNTPLKSTHTEAVLTSDMSENIEPIRLSLCWYEPGVLVINEIPLQEGAAMSSSIAQLQTAIVNALSAGPLQIMPKAQIEFYWPLVPGPHGDNSRAGGEQALIYQLKRLLINKQVSHVLLLGQRSVDLFPQWTTLEFGKLVTSGSIYAEQAVTQQNQINLLLSYSLHQLLAVPSKKAEMWQQMQGMLNLTS